MAQTECGIHTRVNIRGAAHGGQLVDLMVNDAAERADLIERCDSSLVLNERQLCDVELLINGGFSPLTGFMNAGEYGHVVESMRLPEQQLFGLPVVLDTPDESITVGRARSFRYLGSMVTANAERGQGHLKAKGACTDLKGT